jgi:hypothetical protein
MKRDRQQGGCGRAASRRSSLTFIESIGWSQTAAGRSACHPSSFRPWQVVTNCEHRRKPRGDRFQECDKRIATTGRWPIVNRIGLVERFRESAGRGEVAATSATTPAPTPYAKNHEHRHRAQNSSDPPSAGETQQKPLRASRQLKNRRSNGSPSLARAGYCNLPRSRRLRSFAALENPRQ